MKNVKEIYIDKAAKIFGGSDSWINYFKKKIDIVVELENGGLYGIEKPSIEKSFCFDDSYDYDGAARLAADARTNVDAFVRRNLERAGFDKIIESLENGDDYKIRIMYSNDNEGVIKSVEAVDRYSLGYNPESESLPDITERDRAALIEAYKAARENFIKRVNAYLKRYGLSKVRSWTYWGMA